MSFTSHKSIFHIMRIACAMCFIGHGAFGIITKQVWCNYFGVFGIGQELAYQLMPVVGVIDILMGVSLIIYPARAISAWLIFWGLFTALLRPLSGEPVAEFLERAGNYGAPFILLMLSGGDTSGKSLFKKLEPAETLDEKQQQRIINALRVIACTLLIGHGWLNIIEKAGLIKQYTALGFQHPEQVAFISGCFEILGALVILLKPLQLIVLVLFIWKMTSELFYPAYELFEWIERGGSYMILLSLLLMLKYSYSKLNDTKEFIYRSV